MEKILTKLTRKHFYDLFVFNNPKAKINGENVEITDIIILINNVVLCVQAKSRDYSKSSSDENMWLKNKVVKNANKQHKDTLNYLSNNEIEFKNSLVVKKFSFNPNEHVICYITIFENKFITDYKRYHTSGTLGTYPVFSLESFTQVCEELMTPIDIIKFIPFRTSMAIEYDEKYRGTRLIEVKYDDEHSGFIHDFSDPNLITLFVVRSELIDKTASMQQTKRFSNYIDELLQSKQDFKDEEDIQWTNMILFKYSLLDSRKIKDFFECVDVVSTDINQYGIMDLNDGSKIIFLNSHYIDKDKDKMFYHFEQESFIEGIVVYADEEKIYSSYQKFKNVTDTPH